MEYLQLPLKKYRELPFINRGMEGEVRLLNENTVVKKLFISTIRYIDNNLETMKKQITLPTKYFITPLNFVADEYRLYGYTMPYIEGDDGENVYFSSLEKMNIISKKIIEESELFTQARILLEDIQLHNTIYNGELYIIDTLRYRYGDEEGYTIDTIRRKNIAQLNQLFIEAVIRDILLWRKILNDPNIKTAKNLQYPNDNIVPFYDFVEEYMTKTGVKDTCNIADYYYQKKRIKK